MPVSRLTTFSLVVFSPLVMAANTGEPALQQGLDSLQADYGQRLSALEQQGPARSASLSPALQFGLILDGRFSAYNHAADDYELPGFALGGEAGLASEGFSIGHSELSVSANVDDKFYGKLTAALAEHDGETEVELEEAFIETLAIDQGFIVRAGRFLSGIGYLNQQHEHAWDFADAPLVYAGLWGNHYIDDGVRASWLAPTAIFLEIGAEAFAGGGFPAGGERATGTGAQVAFLNLGGDIGNSHSWQAGSSYYTAAVAGRESGGHNHGVGLSETPSFSGDSDVYGASFIYKWAPAGNYKNRHFKLQAEYFRRDEDGTVELLNSAPLETGSYRGEQRGYYLQGVYQFMPQWRSGLRYDHLDSTARGNDDDVLDEAGLDNEGIKPRRYSAMLEWLPSEFSRLRLQFNRDKSSEQADQHIILQYTMSLGAHGAHAF